MLCALGVAVMAIGVIAPVLDMTVAAICSLIVVLAFVEIGTPYVQLVWLCTSLLGYIMFPGSSVWLTYFLVFGIFPILKAYIEKLKRPIWQSQTICSASGIFSQCIGLFRKTLSTRMVG